jgi:hypothetical protein
VAGKGQRIVANAKLFVKSGKYVPVYIKQKVNQWKFFGNYKAKKYSQDPIEIEKHRKHRLAKNVDGILFLVAEDNIEISVKSSRSFPDTETKKKIELAAIKSVTSYYENLGYTVTDCQPDNCGYDLFIEGKNKTIKVEVKGTASSEQRFFISRNERARSVDPLWRLAIVTEALIQPTLEIIDASTMENRFNFESLCWECTTS